MKGVLNNEQIENILCSHAVGRIGCTDGKKPFIIPVTYAYDGKYIYGQTNEGEKLKVLRKNPNVCFEVDMVSQLCNWQSAIVHGKFEELKSKTADKAREILHRNAFHLISTNMVHAHEHAVTSEIDSSDQYKEIMYRISIDFVTGRFERT